MTKRTQYSEYRDRPIESVATTAAAAPRSARSGVSDSAGRAGGKPSGCVTTGSFQNATFLVETDGTGMQRDRRAFRGGLDRKAPRFGMNRRQLRLALEHHAGNV